MTCEDVRIAAMALAEGEAAPLERAAVEEHVASCEACRRSVAELSAVTRSLDMLQRPDRGADLWPAIESRLRRRTERRVLMLTAAALAAYKVVEFAPAYDFGTWIQLAPVIVAMAAFAFLKQNPFKIDAALLRREGEKV